ncbi:MAG: phosphoribosylamine--glycine ligase [Chromatiales bacterium]|nr:phosphoribosylamine--glycine ligase [Chromatiales bacterium]
MNILIIGSGGREHALAWKAVRSPLAERVFVAPGNAGTAREAGVENIAIDALDINGLLQFARENKVGLTIVGPEAPLVAGVVDAFHAAGLRCFGPTRAGAQLEGSKAYAKDFLAHHHIPTAAYAVFSDSAEAKAWIRKQGTPLVVKADGLAAGKGVIIAHEEHEALAAVEDMLEGNAFGDAGHRVVIEQFLAGEEASFIVISDGVNVLPMASSQDHKARDDGDTGPNTGGMGAYSPAPVIDAAMHERVMREVIMPTVRGMADDGIPYIGFLYAGLMIGSDGVPRVLEFNCRFGDPETQPIMMRLRSDLIELCLAATEGKLDRQKADWDPRRALGVVLAAGGYPGEYAKGDVITGLNEAAAIADTKVFHAGTATRGDDVITAGGRVLCVCGLGDTVSSAQRKAYEAASHIRFPGVHYRRDIGYRAIAREEKQG